MPPHIRKGPSALLLLCRGGGRPPSCPSTTLFGRRPSLAALPAPPWVAIACELLGGLPPAGLLFWPLDQPVPGSLAPLPPPLLRLRAVLASLPAPTDVAAEPLAPGPWCLSLPLWGNPLLLSPSHPAGLDSSFADFVDAGVHCLRRLLEVERAALAAPTQAGYTADVRGPLLRSSYAFVQRHVALARVAQLLAALPQPWVVVPHAAAVAAAAGKGSCYVPGLFLPAPLAAAPMALAELQSAMARPRRLPWENGRKEVFFRCL